MKTTLLPGAIAVAAVAACAPTVLPDDEKRPDQVHPGMTSRQVERLMGGPGRTCWIYERGQGVEESVCFVDGMVNTFGTTTQKPGSREISVDSVFTNTWPPKDRPASSATEVAIGMRPGTVSRLKGRPAGLIERYRKGQMGYKATFRDDVLIRFEEIPPPAIF